MATRKTSARRPTQKRSGRVKEARRKARHRIVRTAGVLMSDAIFALLFAEVRVDVCVGEPGVSLRWSAAV